MNYWKMEEKYQLFRSLGASLMTSYLNKDLNAKDDLILWGKNWYFTLLKVNTTCSYIVSYVCLITHTPLAFGYMTRLWEKESGDFPGLSVELFFGFYYYVFNFNTTSGHEIFNYKHKHYGKEVTKHRRQNLTSELRFRFKSGPWIHRFTICVAQDKSLNLL